MIQVHHLPSVLLILSRVQQPNCVQRQSTQINTREIKNVVLGQKTHRKVPGLGSTAPSLPSAPCDASSSPPRPGLGDLGSRLCFVTFPGAKPSPALGRQDSVRAVIAARAGSADPLHIWLLPPSQTVSSLRVGMIVILA